MFYRTELNGQANNFDNFLCTFTKSGELCGSGFETRRYGTEHRDPSDISFAHHICTLPLDSPSSSIWNRSEELRAIYRALKYKRSVLIAMYKCSPIRWLTIIYRDIIYEFISQYHHPPPPQTTAIYRDFKKSTAISKGYNVGLRYIKQIKNRDVFINCSCEDRQCTLNCTFA